MSKLKKVLSLVTIMLVAVYFASPSLLGFSLLHTPEAIKVATNMGAKLACSARYISKFETSLIQQDLASYSPVNHLLKLKYDKQQQRVEANLFGLGPSIAQYYPGLGCSLVMEQTTPLDKLHITKQGSNKEQMWPQGDVVQTRPKYQALTDEILREDNLQGLQTRALLVIKSGQLVAESYADGVDPYTHLLGWSMAKSVTAMLVGRLQYLQKAEMSQDNLFALWQKDERKHIQLQHLLTMSSGLNFDETYAPGSDATRMLFLSPSASDVALASDLSHKPGSLFYYSSGTTNILTRWLHETLGGSQQTLDFLQQELLHPLSMKHTLFETDSSGVLVGSSYMYASARDWAKLGNLMLDMGQTNGHRLLAAEWVKQASTPNDSNNDPRYGYQFWLNRGSEQLRWPELPEDAYAMLGNRQQLVMIIPSENVLVVRLGWSKGPYPTGKNVAKFVKL